MVPTNRPVPTCVLGRLLLKGRVRSGVEQSLQIRYKGMDLGTLLPSLSAPIANAEVYYPKKLRNRTEYPRVNFVLLIFVTIGSL